MTLCSWNEKTMEQNDRKPNVSIPMAPSLVMVGRSVKKEKKTRMESSKGLSSREGQAAKAMGRLLEAHLALTID